MSSNLKELFNKVSFLKSIHQAKNCETDHENADAYNEDRCEHQDVRDFQCKQKSEGMSKIRNIKNLTKSLLRELQNNQ